MVERTVATIASPMLYAPETFTEARRIASGRTSRTSTGRSSRSTNLPEVVKGALFARYSRSDKSLRRLFLDEFVGDLDLTGDLTVDATVGLKRAEDLYERVFLEYGDDSVAQLGGVHLACEQASNLLTKILEWGRLMAYLEQSTRYIPYDSRLQGRYRYLRPSQVCASPMGTRYVADLDALFDTYSSALPSMMEWARERYPKEPTDSDFVYKQTIKAKACDTVRGLLPAATLSNVGIYGTGQAFEALLLRMRAHPLPEAQMYAQLMLDELRKVIPSFLVRVDRPDRGGAWSSYLADDARRHARPRPAALRRRAAGADHRGQSRPTGIPTARTRFSPRSATRTRAFPRRSCSSGCAGCRPTIASRWCTPTSANARIGATSPAARSSARRTASTCSATTARSATCSATGC